MIYRLPPVLRKLRSEHPGVDLLVSNMPTPLSIAKILSNEADLALVTLPADDSELRITRLCDELMVAAFPAGEKGIPEEITPEYIKRQRLLLLTEQPPAANQTAVMGWVPPGTPSMAVGAVEALKSTVASNVGIAILPEVAVDASMPDIVLRPLRPPLIRTLALIEHRNKPDGPALQIVRNALLGLAATSGGNGKPVKTSIKLAKPAHPSAKTGHVNGAAQTAKVKHVGCGSGRSRV